MLNEKFQSARPGGTVKFRIPEPAERMGANFIRYIFFFLIHSTHKKMIIFVFNEKESGRLGKKRRKIGKECDWNLCAGPNE